MSLVRLSGVVANRSLTAGPITRSRSAGGPNPQQLLDTIGAYIPTEITTAYVAAAGGIATIPGGFGRRRLLLIAVGVALLSSFATWVVGHRKARAQAPAQGMPPPSALQTLRAGWFEIVMAAVAFFAWATAMPGSWYAWGENVVWAPALLVFVVSLLVGGLATLLNRDR